MSVKINVVHIDGQLEYILKFKSIVEEFPTLHYCGGYKDTNTVINFINSSNKDYLVFLDEAFYDQQDARLAQQLSDTNTGVIFLSENIVSKKSRYGFNALGTMHRPTDAPELEEKLAQIRNTTLKMNRIITGKKTETLTLPTPEKVPQKLFLQMLGSMEIVVLTDVLYIISHGNYSEFVLRDQSRLTSSKGIKIYEDQLAHHPDFLRIHKSCIVNKQYIRSISKKQRSYKVVMSDKAELEMSYQRKEELLELIMS